MTPDDFITLARRGKTAWRNADLDRAMGAYAIAAADLGGPTAGQSLQSLQQLQFGTATMSKQQEKIFQDAGLLDMSKVHPTGFGGGKFQMNVGTIKGAIETVGNLPAFSEIIRTALKKMAGGDQNTYEALLGKAMPNRNAAYMAEMLSDPHFIDQRLKDLGLSREAMKEGGAYDTFTKDDPKGVKQAFWGQYESMMQAIGAPLMQAALPVMRGVTEFFTGIGAFAANPTLIKWLGISYTGLSAGLLAIGAAVAGGVLFGALGPVGWLAGGLAAVGAAAGTAWLSFHHDWKGAANDAGSMLSNFREAYHRVFSVQGMEAFWGWIKTGAEGALSALKGFATWFGEGFPAAMREDWKVSVLGRFREAVRIHAEHSRALVTHGCFAIAAAEFPRAERALKHFLAAHGGSGILRTHPDGSAEVISRSLAHFGHSHSSHIG